MKCPGTLLVLYVTKTKKYLSRGASLGSAHHNKTVTSLKWMMQKHGEMALSASPDKLIHNDKNAGMTAIRVGSDKVHSKLCAAHVHRRTGLPNTKDGCPEGPPTKQATNPPGNKATDAWKGSPDHT